MLFYNEEDNLNYKTCRILIVQRPLICQKIKGNYIFYVVAPLNSHEKLCIDSMIDSQNFCDVKFTFIKEFQ